MFPMSYPRSIWKLAAAPTILTPNSNVPKKSYRKYSFFQDNCMIHNVISLAFSRSVSFHCFFFICIVASCAYFFSQHTSGTINFFRGYGIARAALLQNLMLALKKRFETFAVLNPAVFVDCSLKRVTIRLCTKFFKCTHPGSRSVRPTWTNCPT